MKKRNRKLRKVLLVACSALILVSISIGATIAYLTDSEGVTNTFSVGKVGLTLDEAPVDANGKETTGARVKANKYHLIPGNSYDKDPTVHVDANSEDSWIFVKVENGLANIEIKEETGTAKKISTQMTANGWTALEGVDNVYYRLHTKNAAVQDYIVFESFTIDGSVDNATLAGYETTEQNKVAVNITAYAIQAAGFDSVADAWDAGDWD